MMKMKRGDLPPPLPQRVANPRIREDQAFYKVFIRNRTRCTVPLLTTILSQAWFENGRSVFPQSVQKTGTNVELYNVPTYQCSVLFNNMGYFNRKSEFQRPENLNKTLAKGEKCNITDLSLFESSGKVSTRM